MIITDDFAFTPILDFNEYADTIVDIIKKSYPKFSIGIYGEWGTGKTTLMRLIESKLNSSEDNDIVTVWFNAWRYEREEQFALIPLLKKIAYSLPDEKQFEGLKESIKKGIGIIRRNVGQIAISVISDVVRQRVGEDTQQVVKDITNQLIPKIELLTEVNEKDTIYFDGLDNIEKEITRIRSSGRNVIIVVFVDDLDRCSPKKALEVFESVKVFLGVDGFVYVLGLSHETISKLITAEYGKTNSDIKGEQYIKKIIQIPISLPEWSPSDILSLIDDFVKKDLVNEKYRQLIKSNRDLISKAAENNPRELKRFINNYIVANEILSKYTQVNDKELLVIQSINVRWNAFYRVIIKSDEKFRKELEEYINMKELDRVQELDSDTSVKNLTLDFKRLLRDFKSDTEMWSFLREHSKTLFGVKNWEKYRRATESVTEYETPTTTRREATESYLIQSELRMLMNQLEVKESVMFQSGIQIEPSVKTEYYTAKRRLEELDAKIRHAVREPDALFPEILDVMKRLQSPLVKIIESFHKTGQQNPSIEELLSGVNNLTYKLSQYMDLTSMPK